MLQVFHLDVAKVDPDVAYVSMSIHMCCKRYTYVASVCSKRFICFSRHMFKCFYLGCCIVFTHMLQVFHLNVAYFAMAFKCF
jgi:hypothetical protein